MLSKEEIENKEIEQPKEMKEFIDEMKNQINYMNNKIKQMYKELNKEKEKNKELENKIKGVLELIDTKPYTAYTLYGDILYDDENIREILEENGNHIPHID